MNTARLYEVGDNELEDRAIRRMFTNIAPDAVVFICQRGELQLDSTQCCICKCYVEQRSTVTAQIIFFLCEPCLDNAMMRLRISTRSRRAVLDV